MRKRKITLIDKILLMGTLVLALIVIGVWLSQKRADRDYILPENYEGWVGITYAFPGAPVLEKIAGVDQLVIPDSGQLVTSSVVKQGWGKDQYFLRKGEVLEPLPQYISTSDGNGLFIHRHSYGQYSHEDILTDLPIGTDTTMWDGTRIVKKEGKVKYSPGPICLEYFYVSKEPLPIEFIPPPNPLDRSLKSTEDKYLE